MDDKLAMTFIMTSAAFNAVETVTAFEKIWKMWKIRCHRFLGPNNINTMTGGMGQTWSDVFFKRWYHMPRNACERVRAALEAAKPFFRKRRDATGLPSATTDWELVAVEWELSHGQSPDEVAGWARLSESWAYESQRKFVLAAV